MGACLSSNTSTHSMTTSQNPNSAILISIHGHLHHYPTPVFVSHILHYSQTSPDFFVCNSDDLDYDQNVISLGPEQELHAGQIYFLLPNTMLTRPFTASDMAALAVKASVALNSSSSNNTVFERKKKKKKAARVLPLTGRVNVIVEEKAEYMKSRTGPKRKAQRYSSRKPKLAVRLSTIHESDWADEYK